MRTFHPSPMLVAVDDVELASKPSLMRADHLASGRRNAVSPFFTP